MVVASAEGLDHDVAQGRLEQVAILLLGGPPLVVAASAAPRASVGSYPTRGRPSAQGQGRRPQGRGPMGSYPTCWGPPSWWGWPSTSRGAPCPMLCW